MRRYLWKIAGADCTILEKSGKDSQYSFWLIGVMYLITNIFTYLGFFGMFWGIFDSLLPTFFGTMVLGFLVTTIYRLNLISLEPQTLPVKNEITSLVLTNFIRYGTVVLFAFFVSKSIEMVLLNGFESAGFIKYDGSKGYMLHMKEMNRNYPWLWIITICSIGIFILPVYLRHRLNRAHEYYLLRRVSDRELVKSEYKKFLQVKEMLLKQTYEKYTELEQRWFLDVSANFFNREELPSDILKMKETLTRRRYQEYKNRFLDEPFNTKEIRKEKSFKTTDDFLEAIVKES